MSDIFKIEDKVCFDYVNTINSNKTKFRKGFIDKYKFILCYHATRLDDYELEDIKLKGLIRPDICFLREKAKKRFLNGTDKTYHDSIINYIDSYDFKFISEINFNVSKKILTDDAYHYLLFGSECLHPMAHKLNDMVKHINFRDKLSGFGKPFFIKVAVPVKKVKLFWIDNLYQYSKFDLEEIFSENLEIPLVYNFDIHPSEIIEIEEYKLRILDKYSFGLG